MSQPRLIISVVGGVVDEVLTDAPDLEVILCDFDVDGGDGDKHHVVEFQHQGQRQRACVAHCAASNLPDSDSVIGAALRAAGIDPASPPFGISDRELKTVLAALGLYRRCCPPAFDQDRQIAQVAVASASHVTNCIAD